MAQKLTDEALVKGHKMIYLSEPGDIERALAEMTPDIHLKYLDKTLSRL